MANKRYIKTQPDIVIPVQLDPALDADWPKDMAKPTIRLSFLDFFKARMQDKIFTTPRGMEALDEIDLALEHVETQKYIALSGAAGQIMAKTVLDPEYLEANQNGQHWTKGFPYSVEICRKLGPFVNAIKNPPNTKPEAPVVEAAATKEEATA